jgi:homoaconitase/3-isopropylmalate dehydratase large subunit
MSDARRMTLAMAAADTIAKARMFTPDEATAQKVLQRIINSPETEGDRELDAGMKALGNTEVRAAALKQEIKRQLEAEARPAA